jgi:hypothetical protein
MPCIAWVKTWAVCRPARTANHPGEDLRHRRRALRSRRSAGARPGVSPIGVLAHGTIERTTREGRGLPPQSSEIVGRMSGIGTPVTCGRSRDSRGGSRRCSASHSVECVAGLGKWGRVALMPVRTWAGVTVTSLMPLRFDHALCWLRVRLLTAVHATSLSIDAVASRIEARQTPIRNRPVRRCSRFRTAGGHAKALQTCHRRERCRVRSVAGCGNWLGARPRLPHCLPSRR